MAKKKIVYRVHYRESERGWGVKFFHTDYKSPSAALDAIKACNKRNADDYAKTKCVPDYYIQPESDSPEVVEI